MVLHIVNFSLPKFLASIPTFWPFKKQAPLLLVPTHLTSSGLRTVHEVIGHQQPGLQVFTPPVQAALKKGREWKGPVFSRANTWQRIKYQDTVYIRIQYVIYKNIFNYIYITSCKCVYICCIICYMYVNLSHLFISLLHPPGAIRYTNQALQAS